MVTMDFKEKEEEEMGTENRRCCTDCKTTKTPLWRGGPAGPKSLCNACGLRYRKRRISLAGLSKGKERKRDRAHSQDGGASATSSTTTNVVVTTSTNSEIEGEGISKRYLNKSLKIKLKELGEEVLMQQSPMAKKQRFQKRKKLGEEEQAAFCLMALSCGSVLA